MLLVVPVTVGFGKVRDVAAKKQKYRNAVDVEADGIGKVISLLQRDVQIRILGADGFMSRS